jgi:hypothetical protein
VTSSTLIALIAAVISPASALLGVWLAARLTRQARLDDQQDRARQEALAGLSPFAALAVDSNPDLVMGGQLREYTSPAEAVSGLYQRWLAIREPLILLWVSHPSAQVRQLAFDVQAELELLLRMTELEIRHDTRYPSSALQSSYRKILVDMEALGRSLSPLTQSRQSPAPALDT